MKITGTAKLKDEPIGSVHSECHQRPSWKFSLFSDQIICFRTNNELQYIFTDTYVS